MWISIWLRTAQDCVRLRLQILIIGCRSFYMYSPLLKKGCMKINLTWLVLCTACDLSKMDSFMIIWVYCYDTVGWICFYQLNSFCWLQCILAYILQQTLPLHTASVCLVWNRQIGICPHYMRKLYSQGMGLQPLSSYCFFYFIFFLSICWK